MFNIVGERERPNLPCLADHLTRNQCFDPEILLLCLSIYTAIRSKCLSATHQTIDCKFLANLLWCLVQASSTCNQTKSRLNKDTTHGTTCIYLLCTHSLPKRGIVHDMYALPSCFEYWYEVESILSKKSMAVSIAREQRRGQRVSRHLRNFHTCAYVWCAPARPTRHT